MSEPRRRGRIRWELVALVEVWGLCGLAIVAPILDTTGRAPDFFLFHGAGAREILLLVGVVTFAPPLLLWLLGATTRLAGRRVRAAAHVLTIGALSAAIAIQAGKQFLPVRGIALALLAAAGGAVVAAAYLRWTALSRLLRLVAVGPPVFVLLFVFASPTAPLLRGEGTSTATGRSVGSHPPIVFLILDELPQVSLLDDNGRLDAVRFPNFARLAGDATWYRNATTVSGLTVYAVPSMLTGRYVPSKRTAPHYSQYPDNLFTLLAGSYRLEVQESLVQLCPPVRCARADAGGGLPELLDESATLLTDLVSPRRSTKDPGSGFREPTVSDAGGDPAPRPGDVTFRAKRSHDNQPVRFAAFVDRMRPYAEPTLHFLHLVLPHRPFRYLPSGRQYAAPANLPQSGPWWGALTYQRHELQARYVDHLLGVALDRMRDTGLYDDALVVVTADHGISFGPAQAFERHIYDGQRDAPGVGWVPLFIKAPGQTAAAQDHRNWQHVDLLPTIAGYASVDVPYRVDGVSALGPPRTGDEKPFVFRAPQKRIMLDGARHAAAVLRGPDDVFGLPAAPRSRLIGKRVADLPVRDGSVRATVANRDAFAAVDPDVSVPAFVHGTVPDGVPSGSRLAIAVNGTIGAVVPVLAPAGDAPRFAALLPDDALFRPGRNRLDLYLVTPESHLEHLRPSSG
jgi:hypothetical protein